MATASVTDHVLNIITIPSFMALLSIYCVLGTEDIAINKIDIASASEGLEILSKLS